MSVDPVADLFPSGSPVPFSHLRPSITLQREKLSNELLDELMPLLEVHWREVAHYKDIPLDPNWPHYFAMQQMGGLRIFTARTESKALAGYASYFIGPHPHYKRLITAFQDIIFVHPDHRGLGGRFLEYARQEFKTEGVHVDTLHLKDAHRHDGMAQRAGFELVDLVYLRRLDK